MMRFPVKGYAICAKSDCKWNDNVWPASTDSYRLSRQRTGFDDRVNRDTGGRPIERRSVVRDVSKSRAKQQKILNSWKTAPGALRGTDFFYRCLTSLYSRTQDSRIACAMIKNGR
jgi:hypothetical protein